MFSILPYSSHIQLEVVRNLFKLNGFPSHMFERITRRFFDNTFDLKPSVQTVPKKIIYFCLLFTGIHSLQIHTQINRLGNAAFPHLDTRFAFRSSRRITSFFPFKDKVPKYLRSSFVYLLSVDAVPRRMLVKPHVIYTLEYQSTWVTLLLRENILLTPLSPVCFPTPVPLVTKWTLTISKSFLPVLTRMS